MNPHAKPPISFVFLIRSLWSNRSLVAQMIRREVAGRYKGSTMGLAWSFLNPVLMLAVYTFVFSVVFKARWAGGSESKTEFALVLFSGLILFNLFSECVNKAPTLILNNVNYVKKVIFPLEILPIINLGAALFHWIISLVVWLIFYGVFYGLPHTTILLLPLVMLPLMLLSLGMSWLLASLGVYLRDVAQIVGVLMSVLMFLSPIFYPISSLPEDYQVIMLINPLTLAIEQTRDVMMWGKAPDWLIWGKYLLCSGFFFWICFAWFQKTRKGFADVL
ncbi:ABC transporter permease [Pseudomonas chlororaphis]|uniref:ABC transporter permease n=1 Tax=Pseudomonas chlororaphis TaxID=587753 RepID=UPI0009BFA32C|nr:ABC transporter permease [Pseudomonas chlororaphis]AZD03675.1 O-antigen export system permease protein RfbD [Pseudomonas chlororaphis subsp. chlororaphis]MBM0285294.1 ABC transporter permease [Pseudomonas chlororaphis]MDO1503486.1 ABC transporter permease [Pseudomonas chlororaphis]ORM46935.1 sugar ABC transporter permease [Pseudomonas chlororaphis subsp. chlororaphis]TWR96878.1 ABC transporter permease [Pseudomonas chlororaphis subsp. chlororaphis]